MQELFKQNKRTSGINKRSYFLISVTFVLLFILLYYLPWVFNQLQIIQIDDNLDGEVVVNKIIGQLYRGEQEALFLALNGQIPGYALPRLLHPLSLIYLFPNSWLSYVLTDIVVRSIAFVGIYLLASFYKLPKYICTMLGLCFSTSISFSVYLLSVAGIPLTIYLLINLKKAQGSKQIFILLSLLLIGSNISFALSGLFIMVLILPILLYGFKESITKKLIYGYLLFCLGIFLGNVNIFYAQFLSDIAWHRTEWKVFELTNYSFLQELLVITKSVILGNPFYHVTYSLPFAVFTIISFFLVFKYYRTSTLYFYISLLFFLFFIYIFSRTSLSSPLREISPYLNSFQWDRFYFLYSTIVFLAIIALFKAAEFNRRHSAILLLLISFQLGYNLFQTPHIKAVPKFLLNEDISVNFYEFYRTSNYKSIHQIVGNDAVMSVGIDPMIAPMNGIRAVDGYYVLYPLSYKKEFKTVISDSIIGTNNAEYFEKWGNRVYAFYPKGNPNLLNFCAAYRIGARYIISSGQILNQALIEIKTFNSRDQIILYKILTTKCHN